MGICSCFTVRDEYTVISHRSDSGNRWVSEFNFIIHKVKGIFFGNEVHTIGSAQPQAASLNAGVIAEISETSSSRVRPNVVTKHQSLQQNSGDGSFDEVADIHHTQTEVKSTSHESEVLFIHLIQAGAEVVIVDDAASILSEEDELLHTQKEVKSWFNEGQVSPDCFPVSLKTQLITNFENEFYEKILSPDEEDVCPTCLEEFDHENPKIITQCLHQFHLSCILAWKERSDECPICFREIVYSEYN